VCARGGEQREHGNKKGAEKIRPLFLVWRERADRVVYGAVPQACTSFE